MLSGSAQKAFVSWELASLRIIIATFRTKHKKIKLNIIQCYAPTNEKDYDEKETFYQNLQAPLRRQRGQILPLWWGTWTRKCANTTPHTRKPWPQPDKWKWCSQSSVPQDSSYGTPSSPTREYTKPPVGLKKDWPHIHFQEVGGSDVFQWWNLDICDWSMTCYCDQQLKSWSIYNNNNNCIYLYCAKIHYCEK